MKREKVSFLVLCYRPKGTTKKDIARYIKTAVKHFGGGGDPESPFFEGLKIRIANANGTTIISRRSDLL